MTKLNANQFNFFLFSVKGMSPVSASMFGSRRPSIDGMSSTCTSQSEVRSFKDRLKEHVNQVKVILNKVFF